MTLSPTQRADIAPHTLFDRQLHWLGDPVAGYWYAEHKGTEYAVSRQPVDLESIELRDGEVIVSRPSVETLEDGATLKVENLHRAIPVAAGTYASLIAKRRRPASAAKTPQPVNALGHLQFLTRREPRRMIAGTARAMDPPTMPAPLDAIQREAMATVVNMTMNRPAELVEVGGNEPPATVPELIARLNAAGIAVKLDKRGSLYHQPASKVLRFDERELLQDSFIQRLLIGHLSGQPVPCGLCDEPAGLYVVLTSYRCRQHFEAAQ